MVWCYPIPAIVGYRFGNTSAVAHQKCSKVKSVARSMAGGLGQNRITEKYLPFWLLKFWFPGFHAAF